MKLVHKSLTPLIVAISLLAIAPSIEAQTRSASTEYLRFFNPAQGFKPAQTSLTQIFLQIAGSLEYYGSPVPYLRYIQAEELRIAAKYKAKTGRTMKSHRPAQMTDAYIGQLIENWNLLSPQLGLESFAKEAGLCAREAIRGTRDTGTIIVDALNQHQDSIAAGMEGGKKASFEELRTMLFQQLEWGKKAVDEEGYETARRDAVSYAFIFKGIRSKLYAKLDAGLPHGKSPTIKAAIDSVFLDLGHLAQTELELGVIESALR